MQTHKISKSTEATFLKIDAIVSAAHCGLGTSIRKNRNNPDKAVGRKAVTDYLLKMPLGKVKITDADITDALDLFASFWTECFEEVHRVNTTEVYQ